MLKEKSSKPITYQSLWSLLSGYRLNYFAAIASQGLSIVFRSALYMLLAWFVDNWLLESEHSVSIWGISALFVLFSILQSLFSYFAGKQLHFTAENICRRLRNDFYDHIQRMKFAWHDKVDTGDLIVRATSDIESMRKLFAEQFYDIARIFIGFVINFILMVRISPRLAFVNLIIIPLILVTAMFFFSGIAKIYEAFQNQDSVVSTVLQENLTGVRVVKAFARQEYEIEKFNREAEKRFKIGMKELLIESFFWPASDFLCYGQMVLSLYMGTQAAIADQISLGDFVAYQSLITMVIWPLRNLGRQIVYVSRSKISFGRIKQVLSTPQEDMTVGRSDIHSVKENITFDHVNFSYTDQKVLEDISFTVPAGSVTALVGSTGCGKTSLINLLPRFYDYQEGSIRIDGVELNEISRSTMRAMIGIVEQEPFLFSCSIADNIAYGVDREVSRDEIIAAAKSASIHESIMNFDDGYDTIVGERGVTLSGGQKQRVAIARAFLKNPQILILDDSLSAVDTVTEAAIQQALRSLMKDRTTFIIAHRTTSITDANQIFVMDEGKIIQRGTHRELIAVEGMYQNIHQIQTRIESELEKELSHE